jgi:putative NADH-flavin reductase
MKIVVFGATGRVGSSVIEQALQAGHDVTAFVRDPTRFTLEGATLSVAVGDVRKPDTVRSALAGTPDAVVVTVGADPLKPSTIVTESARAIVDAATSAGVRRYLGISGTAQMPKTLLGRLSTAILRVTPVRHGARDHDGAFEIVSRSGLEWTLAGCPWIKDVPPRGTFRTGLRFPGGLRQIAPADVARFLVAELTERRHPNQIVGIWY